MSECRRITRELGAYSAATLTPARSARVERHLASCGACAERLRRLEETDSLLVAARPRVPQLGPEASREILAAALAARRPSFPWLRLWLGGWAAAACALLVAANVWKEAPPSSVRRSPAPAVVEAAAVRPATSPPKIIRRPVRVAKVARVDRVGPRRRARRRFTAPRRGSTPEVTAVRSPAPPPPVEPAPAPPGDGHLLVVFSEVPKLDVEVRDLPSGAPGEAIAVSAICDLFGRTTETEVRVSTEKPEPEVILTALR